MADVSKSVKAKVLQFKRREEGQALSEFALVAPLLIIIVTAVLLLGYFIFAQLLVVTSANQGARVGSALISNPEVGAGEASARARTTARSLLSQGLNVDSSSVTAFQRGDQFVVTVNYDFTFPVNLPLLSSQTINHSATYHIWGADDD